MRTKITLRLSGDSRRGWDKVCQRYGVTVTALAEAVGCYFDEHPETTTEPRKEIIERARQIDAERRNRR